MKMTPQQYCLRWKHHHSNVQNMFAQLLEKERFCDVTLYCSPNFAAQVPNKDTVEPQSIRGVSLRAHRVVLAACSELLGALLGAHDALGEPVLVIDGAEPKHLRALLDYMYTGEMSVHHSQLASLLKTAEELRIKGLTDIRWNNKDEPPDGQSGGIITTTTEKNQPVPQTPEPRTPEARSEPRTNQTTPEPKSCDRAPKCYEKNVHIYDREPRIFEPDPKLLEAEREIASEQLCSELRAAINREYDDNKHDKCAVNGGPPPLIKLPSKDKSSPIKRENSDTDTPSPKRQRASSVLDNTDDDTTSQKSERDDWQHGNLDISAERVVNWGMGGRAGVLTGPWPRDDDDDEWADAPADIGSFLDTRLRVDGDNSGDDDSNDSSSMASTPIAPLSTPTAAELLLHTPSKCDVSAIGRIIMEGRRHEASPAPSSKSGPVDPRFMDVVKLNDYLQHGRRPQFWEENYVRRVMEAVRLKELEMKQAAEILGVSYGTLYGRYRDVYGCINRPYRTARDFWQAKGPSEVLERLQRGEVSLESASQALGVTPNILAAHVADFGPTVEKEFEPIPIEIDPSLKMKPAGRGFNASASQAKPRFKTMPQTDKAPRKTSLSTGEEDEIPASVITTHEGKTTCTTTTGNAAAGSGKWPTIRVAQLDTLRGSPPAADPSLLMRTRPDLTIVAAKRTDKKDDENT